MKKYETRDDVPDCIDCDGCGVIGRKPNEWVPFELQCSKCLGTGKDLDALREYHKAIKAKQTMCWWHTSLAAVSTLKHEDRVRPMCASCHLQMVTILNALDAQAIDALIEQSSEAVRDFIEACNNTDQTR